MNKSIFLQALLILGLISQCETINPDEQIPAYVEIPEFTVNEDFSSITDAWVYIDEYLVGIYDLPARFPVLYSGQHEITVRPGIKVNGIAVTRGNYPFYEPYKTNETLITGECITIHPQTQYKENLNFVWNETFESVAVSLEPSDTTSIGFEKSDTVSDAPTSKVAVVELHPDTTFRIQTVTQFDLLDDRDVYLEISYKTDYYFELAWQVENQINGIIYTNKLYQFNPTMEWQHVYIYLTNFIKDYNPAYNKFRFMLGSTNIDNETHYIYIDNIKLIHF